MLQTRASTLSWKTAFLPVESLNSLGNENLKVLCHVPEESKLLCPPTSPPTNPVLGVREFKRIISILWYLFRLGEPWLSSWNNGS